MNDYRIEGKNKFFLMVSSMSETELRPGNTVTFHAEVDLTEIESLRSKMVSSAQKPSYTSFVVQVAALALKEFPYANAKIFRIPWRFWSRRRVYFNHSDIAVAAERSIPGAESIASMDVCRNADRLSPKEITNWLKTLSESEINQNRQWLLFTSIIKRLPAWLSAWIIRLPTFVPSQWVKYRGAAVHVTSPAKYGVDVVTATWAWPIGISFGLAKERPIAENGKLVVRKTFVLTMNFDRRIMAGAQAARFLGRMVQILQNPSLAARQDFAQPDSGMLNTSFPTR